MAIDWSVLTDPKEAINLIFKQDDTYDAYQNNNIFQAVVLTPGQKLSYHESAALQSSFKTREAGSQMPAGPTRISFRARILGPNSPHSFLPNPQNPDFSEEEETNNMAIALHTTFITTMGGNMPKPDDIWNVSLRPGTDNSPFDLQFGDALHQCADGSNSRHVRGGGSLSSLFEGGGGFITDPTDYAPDASVCDEDNTEFYLIHPLGAPAASGEFGWRILPDFGSADAGKRSFHQGVDMSAQTGTPLYAAADGTVKATVMTSCGGNLLEIDHVSEDGKSYKTKSFHLLEIGVEVGAEVFAGDLVGLTGNTGTCTTGPHLHFELWADGNPVDPKPYIKTILPCGQEYLAKPAPSAPTGGENIDGIEPDGTLNA